MSGGSVGVGKDEGGDSGATVVSRWVSSILVGRPEISFCGVVEPFLPVILLSGFNEFRILLGDLVVVGMGVVVGESSPAV